MTKAEAQRLYPRVKRSPANKKLLDEMAARMMADQRELMRRMLRGRGGE